MGYFANAQYDVLFLFSVILNEVKNPTEELTGIYLSLWSWDISLTLNMTYFFILRNSERSEESHRRPDGHILFTLVVGYFACAQYDVLFLFSVILNEVKNPTEELTGIYFSLWSWDISLALNMTCFFCFPSF